MDTSLPDKSSSQPPRNKASRRPHRKSRTGCGNCKLRKVKRPIKAPTSPVFLVSNKPRVQRERGRPRTSWPERRPASIDTTPTPQLSLSRMPDSYRNYSQDSLEACRCLHHYLTWTDDPGKTGSNADIVARVQVPQLGFTFPFLLDFIHGFGALHLARLQPQKQAYYHVIADRLCSNGLRGLGIGLIDEDEVGLRGPPGPRSGGLRPEDLPAGALRLGPDRIPSSRALETWSRPDS
ncbi:hypothetical protein EDB80DRAFT_689190 [Ilyonectria destructans]|nr:hypothetical protein EDB80DRAFT_689190 [Ilyonectria destructans]